jgi:fatty-acyl-CoA synthase
MGTMSAPSMHYATLWEAIADRIPDRPALGHGGRHRSWGEFEGRSALLAGALLEWGLGRGDGVAAYLYNCPEYFETFFAALKIRAVPSNVNYRYRSDELLALLENSGAKVLVYDAALQDRVATVADRLPGLVLVGVGCGDPSSLIPRARAYEEVLSSARAAERLERDDEDVFLSYTGGTTGLPKGVLFRIGQSAGNSLWFRDLFLGTSTETSPVDYAAALHEAGASLSAIPASPLMHSTGFIFASLPTLTAGGMVTTLLGRSFDAHELLATVEETKAGVVGIVGDAFGLPIVRALDEGRRDGSRYDASSLRVICSAGVAWSASIKERLFGHLPGVVLLDSCGSTEGVAYGIGQIRRGDPLSTSNFDAAPGLKVLSPEGRELPPGEIGYLAGPTTASGYYRDPERTARTFLLVDGAQYAMPGDLGRIETDGTVTLMGRGVTTINTGGEKVYPNEVEEVIRAHASVDDCLVLGVPDERFGQAVAALVVSTPGQPLDPADIQDMVRRSLAGYKVPRRVLVVDQLPRLPNGKVDYEAATGMASAVRS